MKKLHFYYNDDQRILLTSSYSEDLTDFKSVNRYPIIHAIHKKYEIDNQFLLIVDFEVIKNIKTSKDEVIEMINLTAKELVYMFNQNKLIFKYPHIDELFTIMKKDNDINSLMKQDMIVPFILTT
jgi:hypothetical protein